MAHIQQRMNDKTKMELLEGNWGICLRILYLLFTGAGLACSIAALGSCNFFDYEPRTPPPGKTDKTPQFLLDMNITKSSVGLMRYDPDDEGCRDLSDDFSDSMMSGWYKTAQAGGYLAVILGFAAIVLVVVELSCCRFPCSRIMMNALLLMAFICQGLTFLVYVAPVCDPNYKNGPFPCSPGEGTWLANSAAVFFLIASVLVCCLPKPVPIFFRVRECWKDEKNTDGCCVCCEPYCGKKSGDDEEVEDEETPEKTSMEDTELHDLEADVAVGAATGAATGAAAVNARNGDKKGKVSNIKCNSSYLQSVFVHLLCQYIFPHSCNYYSNTSVPLTIDPVQSDRNPNHNHVAER
jgi:hypothetical protein